jgi:hypothetical protein
MEARELMLIELCLLDCMILNVFAEPAAKFIVGIKQCWHNKMQQSPQLWYKLVE